MASLSPPCGSSASSARRVPLKRRPHPDAPLSSGRVATTKLDEARASQIPARLCQHSHCRHSVVRIASAFMKSPFYLALALISAVDWMGTFGAESHLNELTAAEQAASWKLLFDGQTLKG